MNCSLRWGRRLVPLAPPQPSMGLTSQFCHARHFKRICSLTVFILFYFFEGNSECVRLLIDVGANLEAHDCHFGTPLHVACAREHLDCVKVLLKAGALCLPALCANGELGGTVRRPRCEAGSPTCRLRLGPQCLDL